MNNPANTNMNRLLFFFFSFLVVGTQLRAQPDFNQGVTCGELRCFRDVKLAGVAYYAPGKLILSVDDQGKPDLDFIQTRYTGTVTYSDRGETHFWSLIRFTVKLETFSANQLKKAKELLWPGGKGLLRPLPVADIQTAMVFTAIDEDDQPVENALVNGSLSSNNEKGVNTNGVFWKEREYTLKLDSYSAQALAKSLEKGPSLMSLQYAFFSTGVKAQVAEEIITEGERAILDTLIKHLEQSEDSLTSEVICVRSDVLPVTIDVAKWPDLIRQIDINEEVPPGYAALEVRCYDFNNNLRPDLFAKKVEVKARGVGHGEVVVQATFSSKAVDLYVHQIKFPYAVRLDQPVFYRVTSIGDEAPPVKSDWIELPLWSGLIDITSSGDETSHE